MMPLKEIFLELSELAPQHRAERLAARCGDDAELEEAVRALLGAHELGEQHAGGPTVEIAPAEGGAPTVEGTSNQIGPYKILRQIGEGGFAKVYLAEQQSPVRRRVALKILKPGMDAGYVVARFDAERQALATMNHAHVAKVFDAGVTESGRPYFVMEHVPGESITAFCDRHHYTIRQRLELFCQACAAVQHAHQKAIIHRDLKPSNILVTIEEDGPQVKVIDFGVAKALSQPLTDRTLFTGGGQLIGTPEYMSPEQADMSALDVDTRSDIYSLGVVLYQLLAGALPFDAATLRGGGLSGIQRIIREVEPPRPSTKLGSLGERARDVARQRRASLVALEKELRGELEWIPLKAMRKERDRRYASAAQLADDIRNFLQNRPLLAGPESKAYRVRKFARRNRGPIAAVCALVVALLLGMVTTSVMYLRSERQRAEAQRQQRIAQARFNDVRTLANTFLFDVHDQIVNLPGTTPARAALVQTALEYLQKLSAQAGDDPELLREIFTAYSRIGDIQGNPNFANLGDTPAAVDSHRKALEIIQKLADANPTDAHLQRNLALSHQKIGDMFVAGGDTDGALESYRRALKIRQKLADADPVNADVQYDVSSSYIRIGDLLAAGETRTRDERWDCYRRALAIREKLADGYPTNARAQRDLTVAHDRIAEMLAADGDTRGALDSYRKSQDIRQKLADADPLNAQVQSDLAVSYLHVGRVLSAAGDTSAALEHYRQALAIDQKLAEADPDDARAQRNLSLAHIQIGNMLAASTDMNGALSSYRQAMVIAQALADADPANANARRDLLIAFSRLANVYEEMAGDATRTSRERIELWQQARSWYLREVEQIESMQRLNLLAPADAEVAEERRGKAAHCDTAIAELTAASSLATTQPTTRPGHSQLAGR